MSQSLNMLEEIRLRRWGREHYVPELSRRKDWHPIILEEMLIKDQEMGRQNPTPDMRFVPLLNHLEFRIDQPHAKQISTAELEMTNCTEQYLG